MVIRHASLVHLCDAVCIDCVFRTSRMALAWLTTLVAKSPPGVCFGSFVDCCVVCAAEPLRVDVQSAAQSPRTQRRAKPDSLTDTDMVLAVEINGEAVAYPVRLMAYHHLVHDVVGGTPIVATY